MKIEDESWNIYLLLAGRGYGKTYKGAGMIIDYMENKENLRIGLIGATLQEVEAVMVNGVSGIIPRLNDKYRLRKRSLEYKTSLCQFFNGNLYESLRGFQFDIIWIDELCKFRHINRLLNQVWLCLRLGISKLIITTTPRNISVLHSLIRRNDIRIERGTSLENKTLSPVFFENISQINDEVFYRQEVEGDFTSGFDTKDIQILNHYDRSGFFILGIDPAVQNGLTGIILVQYFEDKKIVVEDWSTHDPYDVWIQKLMDNLADINYVICVEINQGGNLWKRLLAPLNRKIVTIFSQTSKNHRQQFIHYLYKKGILFNQRDFPRLLDELFNEPADRLDALFFAIENQYKPSKFYLF